MTIGTYELWLDHFNGTRLAYLDSMLKLEYTRVLHGVGVINLTMPSSFDTSLLQNDYKIEVWRALPDTPKRRENMYLIRGWRKWTDEHGVDKTLIVGVDGNDILKRRMVWAQPGSTQSRKTGYAGDILKEYVREACATSVCYGATSSTRRGYILTQAKFAIGANVGDGASFTKNYYGVSLFDVANGICEASTGRGNTLWWYAYPSYSWAWILYTYAPLMGQDLTSTILINIDQSMMEPVHKYDAIDEYNMILGMGGSVANSTYPEYRKAEYAYDTNRLTLNPYSWREKFLDVGSEPDHATIIEACSEEVAAVENRPTETFSCQIAQMEDFRYGRDWDLGDKISVSYRDLQRQAVIKAIAVTMGDTEEIRLALAIDIIQNRQTS